MLNLLEKATMKLLLIYTDEGPLYNTFINLFYSGDSGYPEKEHDDYIWHVEGPFQGYLMNIDTKKNELRDALPNLAEYFYVLEEGAKFPYLAVLFLFVILLMLIIFLINTYKKQKTLRFQLKK